MGMHTTHIRRTLLPLVVLLIVLANVWFTQQVAAQVQFQGKTISPEQMEKYRRRHMRNRGGPVGAQPVQPAQPKPEESKEKKEDKPAEEKKVEDDQSVKRPDEPANAPDPSQLQIELENGRVPPFSFVGQKWQDVLQWLANLSKLSLDWQELPSGYLNLTTQRSLSPAETRDLINRHLHARGYTLLIDNDVLSVFKIDKLDPSLVPRVSEEELYDLQPHDFVKTTFQLAAGTDVEKAVKDIEQMLSPHKKVMPLVATERALVMDIVANLRLVSEVLNQERTAALRMDNIREFPLQYARAEGVINMLYVALGMDPNAQPTQMELAIQQQKMQLMMQMQQAGKDVSKLLGKEGPPVYLVFNRRRNSVIANAPPAEMRIIAETVKLLDVPPSGEAQTRTLFPASTNRKLRTYELKAMDPAALQMTLEEIGNLDPLTELRADSKAKLLFARASEADHEIITSMIKELDTGRRFELIRLRKKPAEVVAAGIYKLMVGEEEKEEDSSSPYFRRYIYGWNNQQEDESDEGFRVSADIESNSLWLWASDSELKTVKEFLKKLGEDPDGETSSARTMRTYDDLNKEATQELLNRLQHAWSGKNQLIIIPQADPEKEEGEEQKVEEQKDRSADANRPTSPLAKFAQHAPSEQAPKEAADKQQSPADSAENKTPDSSIRIAVTEDGRLVYSSSDTQALDQLESMIEELAPRAERFKRIHLEHIRALTMVLILDDLFEKELEGGDDPLILDMWEYTVGGKKEDKDFSLARRAKLQFDYDERGNAVIVANATPRQLYEIEKAIEIYDQPYDDKLMLARRTEAIKMRYSDANVVASAVKDAYRDLLSQRDSEFDRQSEDGKGNRPTTGKSYWSIIHYGGPGDGTPGELKTEQLPARFDGSLSIGVDEISNMIIVSAREKLFDSVVTLVKQLDEQARPRTKVTIHQIQGALPGNQMKETLSEVLGEPWLGNRPPGSAQSGGRRGGGDSDRRDRRRR